MRKFAASRTGLAERKSLTGGFTMIELIVVIGIIVLAAGMMTPTIAEYFRGRELKLLQQGFRSTINDARLRAVNERSEMRLLFFREGVRVYSERDDKFVDKSFSADVGPFVGDPPDAWYELGFLDHTPSTRLPAYRTWEKRNVPRQSKKKRRRRRPAVATRQRMNLDGVPQIAFLRDGTIMFATGSDVPSGYLKEDQPRKADLAVYRKGNNSVCLIDLQLTGQNRSKIVRYDKTPTNPGDSVFNTGDDRKKKKRRGRRGRRRS